MIAEQKACICLVEDVDVEMVELIGTISSTPASIIGHWRTLPALRPHQRPEETKESACANQYSWPLVTPISGQWIWLNK